MIRRLVLPLLLAVLALGMPPDARAAAAPQPVADSASLAPAETELVGRPALTLTKDSDWDTAEAALSGAINALYAAAAKAELRVAGAPMIEYLESGDETFRFTAFLPLAGEAPAADYGSTIAAGVTPQGKSLKFVHQGRFEELEDLYNRIDEYLAEQNLEMGRVVEEYASDPATTNPDQMVTHVYVFTE